MSSAADGPARAARPRSLPAVFEHAPVALLLVDPAGVVVAANEAACALFDVSRCELVGAPLSARLHEDETRSGPERRYHRPDGATLVLHERWSPLPDTQPPLRVLALEDATDRRSEAERLRTLMTLAYLGEMASVMAHEVRNAFAGIRGAVEVIGHGLPTGSEEREAVEHVRQRMDGLEATVRDLLRFARVPPPRLSPVSAREVLGDVACAPALGAPPVHLAVQGRDVLLHADREVLTCALESVCASVASARASAWDPADGAVSLHVEIQSAGEHAELRIGGGGGRLPRLAEELLRPFFESPSGGPPALPIAKRLLEAQGAELVLEGSEPDAVVVRIAIALRPTRRLHVPRS